MIIYPRNWWYVSDKFDLLPDTVLYLSSTVGRTRDAPPDDHFWNVPILKMRSIATHRRLHVPAQDSCWRPPSMLWAGVSLFKDTLVFVLGIHDDQTVYIYKLSF